MRINSYAPGTPCWVDIGTTDVPDAQRFYGTLFGWTFTEAEGGYSLASKDGAMVAGLGSGQNPGPPTWTTYFATADVDATTKAVREEGGTVLVEPMEIMSLGRMAVYLDPVGATFSAWEPNEFPGAQLVNEAGSLIWNELSTRDTEGAQRFYGRVFGLGAKADGSDPVAYTEWQVDGRSVGGMMPMDDSIPADLPTTWQVYFAVDDCKASTDEVTELGGKVRVPPTDIPIGRFSIVEDPQGGIFALCELAPEAATG